MLDARGTLTVGNVSYEIFRLDAALTHEEIGQLPYVHRILLEQALRVGTPSHAAEVAGRLLAQESFETPFRPSRLVLQDFTGIPVLVDYAAFREAAHALSLDAPLYEPAIPIQIVVDHSVQVDAFGSDDAFRYNFRLELERNQERFALLQWAQRVGTNVTVVPPGVGIIHQLNVEYLARVVESRDGQAFPDTIFGGDSHTPMANGLGVLGWGVGGLEVEAAMLGEEIPIQIPPVVGLKLTGDLAEGVTATDLTLTVTEVLRKVGVVGKFVEFFGPGLTILSAEDRITIANMAPEYGSQCAYFPIDEVTVQYLRLTRRPAQRLALVEAYCKENRLWHDKGDHPSYSQVVELDLGDVEASLAGPRRPQDRVPLRHVRRSLREELIELGDLFAAERPPPSSPADVRVESRVVELYGESFELKDGSVVLAAITGCLSTSNPHLVVAAGLLAKKAVERGLRAQPWVKTSFAPGSRVVTDYCQRAGLTPYLDELGFNVVAYGCTTCIGLSGPLPEAISEAIQEANLNVASVLSGNRNFEGRINPDVRFNYLASPPLVVAYAIAGTLNIDVLQEPLGQGVDGPVHLRDIWPTTAEVQAAVAASVSGELYDHRRAGMWDDAAWGDLKRTHGSLFAWAHDSTYIRRPPYVDPPPLKPAQLEDIRGARCLAVLGDAVTTDYIAPAGAIKRDDPAGRYLINRGVEPGDFNSYSSRRGNAEMVARATFANLRLRNLLAPGTEGGVTLHLPDGEPMPMFDAAMRYQDDRVPLIVIAGKEYGLGSARDGAAKGVFLLGVRAVIAESFQRDHRWNLVTMGVLPLQFARGLDAHRLGLTGREEFSISGLEDAEAQEALVTADEKRFTVRVRLDSPREREYLRHGGMMPYLLRRLVSEANIS
jgi:aconitate hydratase